MRRRRLGIRIVRHWQGKLAVLLVLAATLALSSVIAALFWEPANIVSLSVLALSVGLFLPFCLTSQRYQPAFWLGAALLAALVLAHVGFVRKSGTPMNLNMILSYFPGLIFIPLLRSKVSIDRSLRYLVWLSAAYILFYVLGYDRIVMAATEAGSNVVKGGDLDRGVRLFFAPAFAAFLFFFMLEWRRGNLLVRLAFMAAAVAALWISDYRTFMAIFVLIAALRLLRLLNPLTRLLIFAVVAGGYGMLLAGLYLPDWEPFALFDDDGSGFARLLAYRHITPFLQDHWLLGVGIAGSNASLQHYLHTPTHYSVYPTDLGPIGPLFVFGIGGLLLYVLLTYLMIVKRLPYRIAALWPERAALHLTAMVCGIAGIISPSFLLETNSFIPALMIAGWLQLRRVQPGKRLFYRRWGVSTRKNAPLAPPEGARSTPPPEPHISPALSPNDKEKAL
ncbi:MAG: hypothetical protein AB7E60_15420 [Sphingobium sp.]